MMKCVCPSATFNQFGLSRVPLFFFFVFICERNQLVHAVRDTVERNRTMKTTVRSTTTITTTKMTTTTTANNLAELQVEREELAD
jgi:hypothetical protein